MSPSLPIPAAAAKPQEASDVFVLEGAWTAPNNEGPAIMSDLVHVTRQDVERFCEDPCEMAHLSGVAAFRIAPADLDRIHLAGLRLRFAELAPKLHPLGQLAEENRVTEISALEDVAPLLFPHTEYKSYPLSLIDNGRFDQLNAWLDDYTTHDLSGLDLSACQSLDDWLTVVETQTPVRVISSSGTSGKISLLPRSTVEEPCFVAEYGLAYSAYPGEPGLEDPYGSDVYHISFTARQGRVAGCRSADARVRVGFGGDEDHMLTMGGELSTDVLWMTGRLKKAQADGMVEALRGTKAWSRLSGKIEALEAQRAQTHDAFYHRLLVDLKGKTVVGAAGLIFYAAILDYARQHGLEIAFAPNSCLMTAGGLKGQAGLTEAQIEEIRAAFPPFGEFYGCSELMALARKCPEGHFHMPPSVVNFVLDPDTGAPKPREGSQTGRYAYFDLWAQTYWGGVITGDEVTMNWEGGCGCGRVGAYMLGGIGRFADRRGGDDKITCQRTAAAVEEMMETMRSAAV